MRLLSISECDLEQGNLVLRSFTGASIPIYAILSHRWTDDEVLFEDVDKETAITRKGYFKLKGAILQACADGHEYLWDDTCCIDKSSSAELSEAINSMWVWYQDAATCYAYLCDVPSTENDTEFENHFSSSGWFTRGWTLQELIAPSNVSFYNATWDYLGTRETLHSMVSSITGIEADYLDHTRSLSSASIAKRMSWAAKRETTRSEDIAYCLMGIFSVNMPMLYGEGSKAFQRLQEEILKVSDDESIFAWRDEASSPEDIHGLLAATPTHFLSSGNIAPCEVLQGHVRQEPLQTTSRGLRVQRGLWNLQMPLFCQYRDRAGYLSITVKPLANGSDQFARCQLGQISESSHTRTEEPRTLYFPQVIPDADRFPSNRERAIAFSIQISEQTEQSKVYARGFERKGLHPLSSEVTELSYPAAKHLVPKQGTHPEVVVNFNRRVDYAGFHVVIGSFGSMELGFAAADRHTSASYGSVGSVSDSEFKALLGDMYETNAVRIGSSIVVAGVHRITVMHVGTRSSSITDATSEMLELDVVALDNPQPSLSCCCLQ